jgi:Beta/Gamma crystallin
MADIHMFEHNDFNAGHETGDPGWEIQTDQDWDYIGDEKNDKASSVIVNTGTWNLFADTAYAGKSMRLRPGRYPSLEDAGLCNDCLSSFKRVG